MRDKDCANKNKSAIFGFGVPTKNFAQEMLPPELSRVFRLARWREDEARGSQPPGQRGRALKQL